MNGERRRDHRYPFTLRVVLCGRAREIVAVTGNVSFRGLSICTDARLAERQLVRLRMSLPPDGDDFTGNGMVARCIPAKEGVPNVGIQLFALSQDQRERWKRFVRFVAVGAQSTVATAPGVPPTTPDPIRRKYPRSTVTLQVRVNTLDELEVLFTDNISNGGMFVRTALELPIGAAVKLGIVHPKTGEQYQLTGLVRWRGTAPTPGLGLEFTNMNEERRVEFSQFVSSEIPVEEVEYVVGDHVPSSLGATPSSTVSRSREP